MRKDILTTKKYPIQDLGQKKEGGRRVRRITQTKQKRINYCHVTNRARMNKEGTTVPSRTTHNQTRRGKTENKEC